MSEVSEIYAEAERVIERLQREVNAAFLQGFAENTKLLMAAQDRADAADAEIERLREALANIYAWYPISVTQPRQTIDEIREFARAALNKTEEGDA